MSADDFQNKYASVMESMLKSAIAETTKLFETMVDELKAEISQIKKENEDLKTRCIQYETGKSHPVKQTRETSLVPDQSDASEKCDTAVQCDLGPCRTVLVEQCTPLRLAEVQNKEQQYANARINYSLQEHNYVCTGEKKSVYVKQEESYNDSSLQHVFKEEEIESSVSSGQVMSNDTGSKEPFVSGHVSKGPVIQECSTEEIKLTKRNEATQVVFEPTSLGTDNSFKDGQNQSCNPQESLVISLKDAFRRDFKEECEVDEKMAETATHQELVCVKHSDPQESNLESVTSVNKQNDIVQHAEVHCIEKTLAESLVNNDVACEELKDSMAEGEASSTPNTTARRKRGRPPKKRRQQITPPSTLVSKDQGSTNVPSEEGMGIESSPVIVTENVSSSKPSGESSADPMETSSITSALVHDNQHTVLEDKKKGEIGSSVSVEYLSSSVSDKQTPSGSQQLSKEVKEDVTKTLTFEGSPANKTQAESLQTASCHVKGVHTPASLQDAMLLVEAMNQSIMKNAVSQPQSAEPKSQCAFLVKDKSLPHSVQTGLTSKPLDLVPPHTTQSMESSADASRTTERLLPGLLVSLGAPSKSPRTIIIVPKPGQSLAFNNSTGLPSSSSLKVNSTAEHNKLLPVPTASVSPVGTSSLYTPPQKTCEITCNNLPPVCPLQATTVSSDKDLKTIPQPEQKMPFPPRQVEAEIISNPGLIILKAKQDTTELTAPVSVESSTQSISQSMDKCISQPQNTEPKTQCASLVVDVNLTSPQTQPVKAQFTSKSLDGLYSSESKDSSPSNELSPSNESSPSDLSPSSDSSSSNDSSPSNELNPSKESSLSNLDETVLSEKVNDSTENQDSSEPAIPVCKTVDSPTDPFLVSETSNGQEEEPEAPMLPPTAEPRCCAVVRLIRLPSLVSAQKSILVSRLFSEGFSEGITQKPSKSTVAVSGRPFLNPVKTPHMHDEPKRPSLPEVAPASRDEQALISSTVSEPVVEISNEEGDLMDFPPVPCTSDEVIYDLSQKSQLRGRLQLTHVTPKDPSYPHLRMTKAQFLAQLSVSPVVQETTADSPPDSTETTTSDKKCPGKVSIVTRLRSHLKNHLKTKRAAGEKAVMEAEPTFQSPKKPRLEDGVNYENIPKAVGSRRSDESETLTSPGGSSLCVGVLTAVGSVGKPASVSRRSKSPSDSDAENSEKSSSNSDDAKSNTVESTSVSLSQPTSKEESGSPEITKSVSITPRWCASHMEDVRSRNKSKSVSPQMPSPMKKGSVPKNARISSSPTPTKSTSTSPNRSTREGAIPEISESLVSLRTDGTTPFKKGNHRNRSIKRESGRSSITVSYIRNTPKNEIDFRSTRSQNMSRRTVGPEKSGESTPTKEPRPGESFKVDSAMKLTKAPKSKRRGRRKSNKSKNQKKLGLSQRENQANNGEVKKCRAKVWYPPTLPPNEVPITEMVKLPPVVVEDKIPHIPPNPEPIVSPLQPLAVIGKHLLRNQCGQCGRVFGSNAALESHVSLHAGYRLFSCSLCGKVFPDSKTFKRHDRVHRNGRIHICQLCGKGFVYRFGLSKHQLMVHTRIKPFNCQVCNKGFFTKRDVEVHLRIHTGEKPFPCHLCEKKFTRRVELNVHLRWHNGEKRHWCPFCGKGFLDMNNMKRHKITHTGEKPHSCPRCHKRFTQAAHVKKHLRNVHKEN